MDAIGIGILLQLLFALLVWRLLWPQLPAIARYAGAALLVFQLTLLLLYAYSRFGVNTTSYTKWLFNLQMESNVTAVFSTVQILLVASISGTNALLNFRSARVQALCWLLLASVFNFLAVDEYFVLHESSRGLVNFYRLAGSLLMLGLFYWSWRMRSRSPFFFLLPGGLALAGFGGIVLESNPYTNIGGRHIWNMPVEEVLEMLGMLLALLGALGLTGTLYRPRHWRSAIGIFLSLLLCSVALFAVIILAPRAELKYFGERAHITFHRDTFWMRGYRLNDSALRAGQTLNIRLFINANKPESISDGFSWHLIDRQTRASMASMDSHFSDQQRRRIVGRTYRQSAKLEIPADLPANRAFFLTLSLWEQRGDSFPPLLINASDRRQLSETQVVICEFVIPAPAAPLPENALDYRFENGISLRGAELPATARAGETLIIPMTWEATSAGGGEDGGAENGGEDWTQFLHFAHEETGALWNHDQPPLGARLPTRLWYAGLRDVESWQVALPADLPPGRYAVYTGLYRHSDLARLPVRAGGEDEGWLPDARAPLGVINIAG